MARIDNYLLNGGMNAQASSLILKDSEFEVLQNYHLDTTGAITKRLGTARLIGQILDNFAVGTLFFFRDSQGTDYSNVLAAVVGNSTSRGIYGIASNAWADSSSGNGVYGTGITKPHFFTFLDRVFLVGRGNTANTATAPNGSWGANLVPSPWNPKFGCVWQDRVYFANNEYTPNPSRIIWSSLPANIDQLNGAITAGDTTITVDSTTGFASTTGFILIEGDVIHYTGTGATTFTGCTGVLNDHADNTEVYQYKGNTALEITWRPTIDFADINPDDNDVITWIEPLGSQLVIFKNDSLYHWTFGAVEPDKIIDVGTPEGRSVKKLHGMLLFANKYGIWVHSGVGQPQLVSRKIQPFIDAISDLTAINAEVDQDNYYLSVGNLTVAGETYTNAVLVYNIPNNAFYLEIYPFVIKSMARFYSKTLGSTVIADAIYMGDNDGNVYRKGTGNTDSAGGTATPISGYARSKEMGINFPKGGKLKQLYVTGDQARGTKVNYRIDRGGWKPAFDLKERISDGRISDFARTIQLSFSDNSQISPSKINGFTIEYEPDEAIRRKTTSYASGI